MQIGWQRGRNAERLERIQTLEGGEIKCVAHMWSDVCVSIPSVTHKYVVHNETDEFIRMFYINTRINYFNDVSLESCLLYVVCA